ncbi:MAG: collagen-like protein, partial [Paraglaciecola sp.]|nr:collagen-like protein [Paraglaciecola sp.]
LSTALTGCFLDGDEGAPGPVGEQGAVGASGSDGADGQNASAGVYLELIGRAQLNPSNPLGAAEIVQFHAASKMIYAINSA